MQGRAYSDKITCPGLHVGSDFKLGFLCESLWKSLEKGGYFKSFSLLLQVRLLPGIHGEFACLISGRQTTYKSHQRLHKHVQVQTCWKRLRELLSCGR